MSDPTKTTARQDFIDYILGDGYRHLLQRAILSRLGTTTEHEEEHTKAVYLFWKAFPEDAT